MSQNNKHETNEVCASCGITGGDGIKLKRCNACKLVRYCSVACQKEHRPQHKRACKRRASELREELLFKQPEQSHLGDCPICCLPLPFGYDKSSHNMCCSKLICRGCVYANLLREDEESLEQKCPFCRTHTPETDEELNQHLMKRFEANDPFAMCQMGAKHAVEENYSSAFKILTKAAELGNTEAHFKLAMLHMSGKDVEKDEEKELFHLEEAAIGGHPNARLFLAQISIGAYPYNLGIYGSARGGIEKAVKHLIIAANLGHDGSMEMLKDFFRDGALKKEDLAAALHAHKDAVDATKSPQREAAEQFYNGINCGS